MKATDDLVTLLVYCQPGGGGGVCVTLSQEFTAANKSEEAPYFWPVQTSWHLPDFTPEGSHYLRWRQKCPDSQGQCSAGALLPAWGSR